MPKQFLFWSLWLLLPHLLLSSTFVLENDDILPQKAVLKVEMMGKEVKEKTGIGIYIAALNNLENETLQQYQERQLQQVGEPYILLMMVKNDKKIDIVHSAGMEQVYDKQDIYWNAIIPIIPVKDSQVTIGHLSAALLNGYAKVMAQIEDAKDIEFKTRLPIENQSVNDYVRYSFYVMILILVGVFIYVRTRSVS